ncbi:hypothetical protein M422DRAFT_255584 [Sphaerobolus stellatus SS14]|uniref:Uncharacterized protein n=1 Tax=Sphaerobolus stellatus (strain SS14) TaxID=990650 RepID=A0A0C9UEJ1_SPHS4|nr:hypothetical protein M422DRAFT_255584 [Sphaerobolus stellatus SS14]
MLLTCSWRLSVTSLRPAPTTSPMWTNHRSFEKDIYQESVSPKIKRVGPKARVKREIINTGFQTDRTSCGFWAVLTALGAIFDVDVTGSLALRKLTPSNLTFWLSELYSAYAGDECGLSKEVLCNFMGNINRDKEDEELMHWDDNLRNRSHYPEILALRLEGIAKSQPEKANIIQPQTAVQAEVTQVPLSATTPNAQAAVATVDHTSLKEFMATMKYLWDILKDPNANWILNYLN